MSNSTFIICERSFLIRKGLISVIEKIPGTEIIQQFDSEDEIKNLINYESDFIVLNPNLLNQETKKIILEITNSQNKQDTQPQLILLSDNSENADISYAGIIDINDGQKIILSKLESILGNQKSFSSNLTAPEEISNREVDILKNIALGLSNKEIADKLFISAHTVVTHRKNITRKLGIKTVPGLTIYAILNKIININDTE